MIDKIRSLFRHKIRFSDANSANNRRWVGKGLTALNCEVEWRKDGEEDVAHYDFQSGHFGIRVQKNTPNVLLSFLFIAEAPMLEINNVRQLCNQFNLSSDGPRFAYSINEEKNLINVHLFYSLLLDEDRVRAILSRAMTDLFGWQNVFLRKLGDLLKNQYRQNDNDVELTSKQLARELFLLSQQELTHRMSPHVWRHNEVRKLTLKQWMDTACDLHSFVPSELTIMTDKVETLNERKMIEDFEFHSLLIADKAFKRKSATLNLTFFSPSEPDRRRYATIFVQQAEGDGDALRYRITSTLMPISVDANGADSHKQTQPMTVSALVEYDLRTDKQQSDEFRYMWQDAKDKIEKGEVDSLSDEQRLIANTVLPDVAKSLYRGKQLYLQGRYYEAILHLENAFYFLHGSFNELYGSEQENYFEVCYMLGFCYNSLGNYQRAFYYLTFTIGLNRITFTEEYINCLVNMGDFRALAYINNIISELENAYGKGDDGDAPEPHMQAFISFLHRRKAYIYVEQGKFDDAEALLKSLLNDPYSSDFALKELAYLQRLRT